MQEFARSAEICRVVRGICWVRRFAGWGDLLGVGFAKCWDLLSEGIY